MKEIYKPYYTKSTPLVNYMLKWLCIKPGMQVLEPCAGDGVFIDALKAAEHDIFIDAYELNAEAINLLRRKYETSKNIRITHADTLFDSDLTFFAESGGKYDRVIANPPYGAWQDYEKRRKLKKVYQEMYVKETYTLFLSRCIDLLIDGGILVFIIPDTFLNLHMHTSLRSRLLTKTRIRNLTLIPSSFFPSVNFGYSNLAIITLEKTYNSEKCLNNYFEVLTKFQTVEDLVSLGREHKVYSFSQKEIYEHSHHAFFISDSSVNILLNSNKARISDVADCVTGIYTGNDKRYLRPLSYKVKNSKNYELINKELICLNYNAQSDILEGIDRPECFIPVVKGGATAYLKLDNWYIEWSKEAVFAYKKDKKARFQNSAYYFQRGIGVPMVSSSKVTASLIENKLFDQSIVGIFPKDAKWTYYLLAFFNSPTCNTLLRTINPTANNSANYIKKIPFLFPEEGDLEIINIYTKEIIESIKEKGDYNKAQEHSINALIKQIYGF